MYEAYLATRRLELLALWRVPRRADRASSGRRGGVPLNAANAEYR